MEQLEGTIEDIIYTNEKNGYTVCEIRQGKKLITLVGYMPDINIGETILAFGKWTVHPDYGKQLKVETFQTKFPTQQDTLEKYLASGIIKGVGLATARKIIEKFGEDTLKILQFEFHRLSEIKGISKEKAELIGRLFQEKEEMRNAIMFLQRIGLSTTYAAKIYKKFGLGTIEEIKRNPYRMTDEDVGVPFKTADAIAYAMGVDRLSDYRIKCGIKYVLSKASTSGHTYLPAIKLKEAVAKLLKIDKSIIENSVLALQMEEVIHVEEFNNKKRIFLESLFRAEQNVAQKLLAMTDAKFKKTIENIEEKIKELEKLHNVRYEKEQREAIVKTAESMVVVITGGPGTGKTTIIKGIISMFESEGEAVVLAAPTGRAAKRMTEATGREAKTIHRLLGAGYLGDEKDLTFAKNEKNLIDADVIIVDEMSMMDILLMNSLLKAAALGSRLIMVGDVDQLPSVGPGRVLADIIESGAVPTVYLNYIFRQSEDSMIVLNAHKINKGEMPECNNEGKDFFFVVRPSGIESAKTVVKLCVEKIPQKFDFSFEDIQVLSPVKKGSIGIYQLNSFLQEALNPPCQAKNEKTFRSIIFREGDRVMQVKNNYNMRWRLYGDKGNVESGEGVFNGDLGVITDIDNKENILTVHFDDGKVVEYDFEKIEELELAYAITIHKSQGSEFACVVIPVINVPPGLMNRNLLYTGVTRAKKLVILVGSRETLKNMVANKQEKERYSGLKDRLICGSAEGKRYI